ncbi:ferric reduction oxidase 6 [Euphorbia peplus]|nr:ferric reduction oxidase 6 [Euphorbia peplus]
MWYYWGKTSSDVETQQDKEQIGDEVVTKEIQLEALTSLSTIRYGCRPDFKEIFGCMSKQWGNVDVGVIVCGPASMESSVAREIRSQIFRRESSSLFHFNSHSFEF